MSLFNTLPDRVFVISESGVFLDVFGGIDTNSPYDIYKLVGLSLSDVQNESQTKKFLEVISKAVSSSKTQQHIYNSAPVEFPYPNQLIINTKKQWYEGRIHPLEELYEGERAVVWISRNITNSHELKERLVQLSEHDDLTSLLNRRAFFFKAQQCFACLKRYGAMSSVLMIDIDHFKNINDTNGHLFGDEVLIGVAKLLSKHTRNTDSIGRLGGEEFAIILKVTEAEQAMEFAERIRQAVESHTFKHEGESAHLTVSIGVSQIDTSDRDYKSVFQRADDALYTSKRAGRNRVTTFKKEN
ncbi:GGDEF domain-containing protein [Vibrio algarum]|uniref:diguanylate cyclase n=1 Tax=Vibrio algarum TaxID=3020714 RepID=A0ABT4YPE3_9VIBR|nr:GGDEF domain-containing protein [Vibrio sp. KJ40-1]MDB1123428.1 GGDEF domain-containing protein [Vibrio sp. KJ40-1]